MLQIFDIERLKLLLGSEVVTQQKFLFLFLENCKSLVTAIDEALKQGDRETAKFKCHCLKGSCGNVGATCLYELAMKQELMMMADNWHEAAAVQQDMAKGLIELERFIENM